MFNIDADTSTMTIVRKDTASFNVALENYNLDSGDTVVFTVAKGLEQPTPALQITVSDFLDGTAIFTITSEDSNLDTGTYYYDIQVNTRDGRVDTIVGPAKFKVIGGVTY